ncbi:ATP-dependent RNA helicase CshA-like [Agelaius tricolor]|uniref:ATP-dependent RNA helicase CshA-like n=1 Tax=Agelaius tricolor TaxID=9191 RepID=UPI0039F1B6A2
MATRAEWSCPICREASANIAYVRSCLHQFCRGCIVRWARKNPSCPLCRQTVHTIIYPAPHNQGFVEMVVSEPSVSRSAGPEEESDAAGPQPQALVAGFTPETWAFFFSNYAEILWPLEMWLNEVLCGACSWDVAFAQGRIVASLCRYGLHEETLARELQPFLQEQTAAFVRQLVQVAADRCGELARLRIDTGSQQAVPQQAVPQQAVPQQAGPGAVALPGPSGAQEEERREGPGQAGAGTSGAGQSGGCGPGGSWQSGRRRGGGAQESGGHKKAYRRQN